MSYYDDMVRQGRISEIGREPVHSTKSECGRIPGYKRVSRAPNEDPGPVPGEGPITKCVEIGGFIFAARSGVVWRLEIGGWQKVCDEMPQPNN